MATQDVEIWKQLIKKRGLIKAQVTKLNNFFQTKSDTPEYFAQLKLRLAKVQPLFQEFSDIQLEIELIDDQNAEREEAERDTFENSYFSVVSQIETYLETKSLDNRNSSMVVESQTSSHVKLPVISLPTFSGSYHEYASFVETFRSLIDNNKSLQKIQRFHYLLNSLKNEAHNLVSSLDITESNYDRAWQMLSDRYENKRLACFGQIEQLLNLASIKENQNALRAFVDTINKILRNLQALSICIESWDPILVYLVSSKLDSNTRQDWEKQSYSREIPTFSSLLEFLNSRCQILEQMASSKPRHAITNIPKFEHSNRGRSRFNSFHSRSYNPNQGVLTFCAICNDKTHSIYQCTKFLSLSQPNRLQEVKNCKLCINCLKPNHLVINCRASTCRKCFKKHNTMLHIDTAPKPNNIANNNPVSESTVDQTLEDDTIVAASTYSNVSAHVFLSTALVTILDIFGKPITARVLLDSGSQSNFCSREFSKKLQIKCNPSSTSVASVGQTHLNCNQSITFILKSKYSPFTKQINCLILSKITSNLPCTTFNVSSLKIPSNIQLADPNFNISSPIDILIGAELFWNIILNGQIHSNNNNLIYRETQLGWIVSGSLSEPTVLNYSTLCNFSNEVLQKQLEMFWSLEEVPTDENMSYKLSSEDKHCENLFLETTTTNQSGRFIVHLPFRDNLSQLGLSKSLALRRLHTLENKFKINPHLKQQYSEFMAEYERLGHMSLDTDRLDSHDQYYLPHHAVFREASLTSKIRVVFDGSCKTSSNLSINDVLMRGPKLQQNLFSILLRFRTHLYVISGDISKMFRQILIHKPHREFQKILWRSNVNQPVATYKLNTITYGMVCSPFLSIRVLHEIAKRNETEFPEATTAILSDMFVDDLLACDDSLNNLIKIRDDLINLFSKYGFELHKWTSNNHLLIENSSTANNPSPILISDKSDGIKTLGLCWNANLDILNYTAIRIDPYQYVSKRKVLSIISQIYDPLGIISPCIVLSKLIMQELWKLKVNWDDPLPSNLQNTWTTFSAELNHISQLTVPRNTTLANYISLELHGFADSSEKAFGACIYIKSLDSFRNSSVHLLCAKSRVAPIKRVSLPRLELNAALLLAQLGKEVIIHSKVNFQNCYWWSDSVIVLSWISKSSGSWKSYVANRVSKIQSLSDTQDWKHVESKENPADIISRGCLPNNLRNNSLWFRGPAWLSLDSTNYPKQTWKPVHDLEKAKPKQVYFSCPVDSIINRYSSYIRLTRINAYCLRFVHNCRHKQDKFTGTLSSREIELSTVSLVKIVQRYSFSEEIHNLAKHKTLPRNSKIVNLNPFLDTQNILRVGGRLRHATIPYNHKHPMLLPHCSNFTVLLLEYEHIRLLHAGVQTIIASIRRNFWPLALKPLVKKVVFNCIKCRRANPLPIKYLMGDLPLHRVNYTRAFDNCGVDYCGPFLASEFRKRGKVAHKVYVATFVCFSTRAVHLELITDLSTTAFIAGFKRFIARRGICSNIYSDNGTNFVGANREIQGLYKLISSKESKQELSNLTSLGIKWHFIPPRTPHFGGLWERSVRSIKYHLRRVIGTNTFTYEEMNTLLVQIEAVLNSRPITPLSNDPNDMQALTPGHFLIGSALTLLPTPLCLEKPTNMLNKWKHLQHLLSHFWKRWQQEYLHTLQQRNKWNTTEPNVQLGSLVLIKEQNLLPSVWKLGRITALHPGSDNITRIVSIKTKDGVIKRGVKNLALLVPDNTEAK